MKLFTTVVVLGTLGALSALPTFLAKTESLSYDKVYDNPKGSLDSVACSDGPYGLTTRGYTTFGSLPSFPNIGGAFDIAGWDSPHCGSCWKLTYTSATGSKSINVTAIDVSPAGFNVAFAAMNNLTNGQATFLGRVKVKAVEVPASSCGL